ncbi:multidrug ABC transporter ATP-binding protein [Rhodanobacter sp. FW510-R12]|uniref:ABC transporter ATP-binding protein n=1 Tax=unclassified Rhodanobacter TaxID=2621553 RepID=UPI0007A9AC19|nr:MULTISPECIES: ABC transporter ATP-binding protein [unclassified Rhodanobacter]KZC16503.1 multidrug ABC transporter ATP-binding protein [Rhodanobacter sp. FW104-R8]KZC28871.1 multidrug ABC transporter ATP-binding protein [Rhodanobacter sp. FW510-T8]KZC31517.1 multidrug ABC transporter ATP-binding protein [Rhodanobacter sp. FW510-R10]
MPHAHDPIARLDGAIKHYGRLTALAGADLQLHRGELLALLGPNGAGKTTAIGLLLGLLRADGGSVELFGQDPQRIEARRRIGVMLQNAALPPTLRVGELLRLTASYYPSPRTLQESAELGGVADLLRRPYAKLSGGQQRRVQFALALCGRPELLFLDEPTVGMDIEVRQRLWAAIRRLVAEGCAVLLTTHYLEEAEALADRVCVMSRGRMIHQGTVDELRARVALKRVRCLGTVPLEVVRGWPEVSEARRENERLHIGTAEAEAVVRRLLDADPQLRELEVQRAGLAEAFTELTRDAAGVAANDQREAA